MPKNAQVTKQLHSSRTSKVMLKILQARLHQDLNRELPDGQASFRNCRGTRDQIAMRICWIIKKAREFQKNIYLCYIDYAKAFDYVDHKWWKILQEMGTQDYLASLLRNLYAGQEATLRTEHGMADWFQIGKAVCQGFISSTCLFNLYRVYHEKHWAG